MPRDLYSTERLLEIPLFSTVPPNVLRKLMETMNRLDVPPGGFVCREGDPGNSFYIILEGEVDVIRAFGKAEEQLLETTREGDFIGEMSLFQKEGTRAASLIARSHAHLLEMRRDDFNTLIHSDPDAAFEISRVLAYRVRESNDHLHERNRQLEQALQELHAAQAELIVMERLERELELARKIQEDILPKALPTYEGYSFGAKMDPARQVGGDFFDFIQLSDHRTAIVIGDVSDKGVPAAIFMALTRSLVHAEARRSSSPEVVLQRVNALQFEMSEAAMFVTILYGILDCNTGIFEYARAGHELPLMINSRGELLMLPQHPGQPIGLFSEPALDTHRLQMQPGDTLLMYTDGAADATDAEENFFGLDRLRQALMDAPPGNAQQLCNHLMATILAHQGESIQYDDITLVAIQAHRASP
jgi:serine phosphatase RsbU (regulator of sigma subunit)